MNITIATETYGCSNLRRKYIKRGNHHVEEVDLSKKWTSIVQTFRSVFLPQGYPESVSDDYLQYQIWDTFQAFCSSITGTLATQAVLKGVGVGDENATVLAATMTWLMKDGTGMVGRILFAWMQGSYLDCDCKRWRLFADILNDFAIFLEICAPFFGDYFTAIVCVAGVCKSIVGVAGGATRAALTQHQARRNNMADVSAKDGSQETLVNLAGLVCSLTLIPLVTGKHLLIWMLFIIFTFLHLLCNYKAVTCVKMEAFNQARLHIVAQHYLVSPDTDMSVKTANKLEPVLWKTRRILTVKVGCSFNVILKNLDIYQQLAGLYQHSLYFLTIDLKSKTVSILLHDRSEYLDQLKACFHAEVLEHAIRKAAAKANEPLSSQPFLGTLSTKVMEGDCVGLLDYSYKYVESEFPAFLKAVQYQGWETDKALICADEWRVEWNKDSLEDRKMY